MSTKKKVIIIGGGFGGSHAAKKLQSKFDVTLIDTKDYFEFTPAILRTIVEPTHIKKIQVLHNHYLKRAKVVVGRVKEVSKDHVLINEKKLPFDYLIIASGSNYETPFKEQRVVITTRASHLKDYYENLCKAKKILVIGGGLVAVELVGEILDRYKDKEITIVDAGEKLIARNNEKAIKYADNYFRKKGVNIVFKERIKESKEGTYVSEKGTCWYADLVFLCTGISPNYDFLKKNFSNSLNQRNFVEVNKHFQLKGNNNIFAIGDVSAIREEKTAQNAERHADVVVHNICSLEENSTLTEYQHKKTPLLISLGKYRAILSHGNFVLTGMLPAAMKAWVEVWEMLKKRKI